MASALEFYASAFDAESLYGLRMVIAWISVAVFIWLLSLSYLVWKADSKSTENRFMGVLLTIEGIKSAFLLPDAFPYDSDWEWLWDYLWVFKLRCSSTLTPQPFCCIFAYRSTIELRNSISCSTQPCKSMRGTLPL